MTLIKIKNLNLNINNNVILKSLNFEANSGEILGIIGESGSGKSMTANSIIKLLPNGSQLSGEIIFNQKNLLETSEMEMCQIRGKDIGFIFQEPMTALNPLKNIGDQVAEVIRIHLKMSSKDAIEKAAKILDRVGLPQKDFPLTRFPYELSGGQRQRVVIAMAIAIKPKLLIADEPSTALDVTTQAKLIKLLKDLVIEDNLCLLMITHDLSVIAEMANNIIIMKDGEIVEKGKINILNNGLKNKYSKNLLIASNYKSKKLKKVATGKLLLKVDNISRDYQDNSFKFFGKRSSFNAVRNVSFYINYNENVGLVGESGCGKSTITRAILGLDPISSGKIFLENDDVTGLQPHMLFNKGVLRTFQIAHEFSTLTVLENLMMVPPNQYGENLVYAWFNNKLVKKQEEEIRNKAIDVIRFLNLEHLTQELAGNLSGGQKKLLELGRTMMVDSKLVLLDEVGAGVNRTLLNEISDAILRLNKEKNYTFFVIEHDMDLIEKICDPVIVMAEGSVLFEGSFEEVKSNDDVIEAYLGRGLKVKNTQND